MLDPCSRADAGLRAMFPPPFIGYEQLQPLLDMNTLHVLHVQPLLHQGPVRDGTELTGTCTHLHDRHGLAEDR